MSNTQGTTGAAPRLDELMLAMDVVDTLRHQANVVARELGQDDRDEALMQRLRRIYEGQGLEVTDRVLREGIRALKEQRFTYVRRGSAFGRFLAHVWVRRRAAVGMLAALVLVVGLALGWSAWQRAAGERAAEAQRVALTETLPDLLARAGEAALQEAATGEAEAAIRALMADGERALARGDGDAARAIAGEIEAMRRTLAASYVYRIVSRPDEASGVFRVPDVNTGARNYYLIVEAVTPQDEVLQLPVRNEETGRTETVPIFGVRVAEEVFEAVRRDKSDDGIVQDDIVARKPRGTLEPDYAMPVRDGMITAW